MGSGVELKRLNDMGILTSHIDNLVSSVDVGKGVGKFISGGAETTLKLFSAVDKLTRKITALGSESRFNDYLHQVRLAVFLLVERLKMSY